MPDKIKPVAGYTDLKTFFENTYKANCTLKNEEIIESSPYVFGEYDPPKRLRTSLACDQTAFKGLPSFTAYLGDNAADAAKYDFKCYNFDKGGITCFSQYNDFSFLIGRVKDALQITHGHYGSYSSEYSKRTTLLESFINSVKSDVFWIPASW
jgi:hypothetical protein